MKVVAIIQARVSSTRLPAKIMLDLCGKTLLERVVNRVHLSELIDDVWIATSSEPEDILVERLARDINVNCYRGNLLNVMERFYHTAKLAEADIIVRITADNPLTEPSFIDLAVKEILKNDFDYIGFEGIPLGSGVEAFTMKSFNKLRSSENLEVQHYEHVTSYYYQNPSEFNVKKITSIYSESKSDIRVTVDTINDYIFMAGIYNELTTGKIKPKKYLEYVLART